MLWKELIKIALMGTERTQLSEQTKTALQSKGIQPGSDEARIILEGASYYAMMHKSGIQAIPWTSSLPLPAPVELQENACSSDTVHCLNRILGGSLLPP